MAHTACVFVVAGKIAAQDLFPIKKPPEKYWQDERHETDREPRTECKRHADEKPERASVHRATEAGSTRTAAIVYKPHASASVVAFGLNMD